MFTEDDCYHITVYTGNVLFPPRPTSSPQRTFSTETNLNLQTLWSPPSVPTGAVLKLGGSMSIDNSALF